MQNRDVDPRDPVAVTQPFGDLVLRSPPNWTAVGFFGMLGALHLMISVPTLLGGRWEGYLSLIFGTVFVLVAGVCTGCRYEMAVLGSQRRVRLRSGMGRRFCLERTIPFAIVRGVRLTLSDGPHRHESKIELLCPLEDVACPPTHIPRQEALFLAMALNVPLTKVLDEPPAPAPPDRMTETANRRCE
jgi:hypothetical protein